MSKDYFAQVPKKIPAHIPERIAEALQDLIDKYGVEAPRAPLTRRQLQLLDAIDAPEPPTVTRVATMTGIKKSGASLAIKHLVRLGLVEKMHEGRRVFVKLTELGRRARHVSVTVAVADVASELQGLTRNDLIHVFHAMSRAAETTRRD